LCEELKKIEWQTGRLETVRKLPGTINDFR
jgi:hypothetical protein